MNTRNWTLAHIHTHILMLPDTCTQCMACKCAAPILYVQLEEEGLDVHDGRRRLHTSGYAEHLSNDHDWRAVLGVKMMIME